MAGREAGADGSEEEVRGELKELAAAETSTEYGTEDSIDGEKEPGREWCYGSTDRSDRNGVLIESKSQQG